MSRISRFALAALATCAVFVAGSSAQQQQTFDSWGTLVDPDAKCIVLENKGRLTITIPNVTHDLTYDGDYAKTNAPRLLRDVEDDFTMEVKVLAYSRPEPKTSSGGRYSFVSAGLVIWVDDKSFIRLERSAESKTLFVWMIGVHAINTTTKAFAPQLEGLKVQRK